MSKKKTHEEYVQELSKKNPNLEVLENYIGLNSKIKHKCLTHNVVWEISPYNALMGKGCHNCKSDKIKTRKRMAHEQYVEYLKELNPNIKILGTYVNAKTPVLYECLICGNKWTTNPEVIKMGCGCTACAQIARNNKRRKSHHDFINALSSINENIEPIGEYVEANIKMSFRCKIDGHIWSTTPASILYGCGCPKCAAKRVSEAQRMSHEQFIDNITKVNTDVEVLGKYNGSHKPILCRCTTCNHKWEATPSNLMGKHGCPQCNSSRGEKEIRNWLNENGILYEAQKLFADCRDKRALPFDFYLPEYNVAIEYDGKQHFQPMDYFGGENGFKYVTSHDKIKTDYCKNNNIRLCRIPYYKNVAEELNNFLFI